MAFENRKPATSGEDPEPRFDEDNPEWTEADFARAQRVSEVPELADIAELVRKGGRPRLPSDRRKRRVTIMLDPDVVKHFRAGGRGWQTRMNAALRRAAGLADD